MSDVEIESENLEPGSIFPDSEEFRVNYKGYDKMDGNKQNYKRLIENLVKYLRNNRNQNNRLQIIERKNNVTRITYINAKTLYIESVEGKKYIRGNTLPLYYIENGTISTINHPNVPENRIFWSPLYLFELNQKDYDFKSNIYSSQIITISEAIRFIEVMCHVINNFSIEGSINWHHLADQIQNWRRLTTDDPSRVNIPWIP